MGAGEGKGGVVAPCQKSCLLLICEFQIKNFDTGFRKKGLEKDFLKFLLKTQ